MACAVLLLGCSIGPKAGDTSDTASTSAASSDTGPTTSPSATDTAVTDGTSMAPMDLGSPEPSECALGAGDCPEGFKCNPTSIHSHNVGSGPARCVPVVTDAKPSGAPCLVLGDAFDGADDCQAEVVCLFPDDQGNGECHALCDIDGLRGPSCAPGLECFRAFCQSCYWGYCGTSCDPREPDACGPGDVCITSEGSSASWACTIDGSGDAGQAGDPCEFQNACDPGLQCINAEQLGGACADGINCCTPMCSTEQPNTCPNAAEGEVCVPWYSPGTEPPHLATLGICVQPE